MSERRGESNNLLIQSLRENAKNKKHPTKHKRVAKSLEVLAMTKVLEQTKRAVRLKFLRSFAQQFIRKTWKIASVVVFV